jgi:hypothetical protein
LFKKDVLNEFSREKVKDLQKVHLESKVLFDKKKKEEIPW